MREHSSSDRERVKQPPRKPPLSKRKWALEEMSKVWLILPPVIMTLLAIVVVLAERLVLTLLSVTYGIRH